MPGGNKPVLFTMNQGVCVTGEQQQSPNGFSWRIIMEELSLFPVSSTQQTVEGFHFSTCNSSTVAFPKYFIGDFKWLAYRTYCGPGNREWDKLDEIDMCNDLVYKINLVQYCYKFPWWTGETCCANLVTWTWALHNGERAELTTQSCLNLHRHSEVCASHLDYNFLRVDLKWKRTDFVVSFLNILL